MGRCRGARGALALLAVLAGGRGTVGLHDDVLRGGGGTGRWDGLGGGRCRGLFVQEVRLSERRERHTGIRGVGGGTAEGRRGSLGAEG